LLEPGACFSSSIFSGDFDEFLAELRARCAEFLVARDVD
jgi:hypothetical protein